MTLPVRREVRLDAEVFLGAARAPPKPGDDLVEDIHDVMLRREIPQRMQELLWLEIRTPALHRLDDNRREVVRLRLEDGEGLVGAVVEHEHVLRALRHDARRAGLPGASSSRERRPRRRCRDRNP